MDLNELLQKVLGNTITMAFITPIIYSIYNKLKNRMGEMEDKQDATIAGLKSSRSLNGQFTEAFEKELTECRRRRQILNKDVKIINE